MISEESVRRGEVPFPLPGNPLNVPNEQHFWTFFGSARDRSDKNARSNRNIAALGGNEALRAMFLEINHS